MRRLLFDHEGVAMVEATIGTVLLLLAALGTIQLVLVFHGALAGHSAVVRAARSLAVTGEQSRALQTFQAQMTTSLRGIEGTVFCTPGGTAATCEATITVPSVMPGAGLFTGSGPVGPVVIPHIRGTYPYGSGSGN